MEPDEEREEGEGKGRKGRGRFLNKTLRHARVKHNFIGLESLGLPSLPPLERA